MTERRVGKELEDAILSTVWDELQSKGYQYLTISEVARLSKTNKNTIYRHWSSKPILVFAAIQQHIPETSSEIPNTGDLQRDLESLLGTFIPIFSVTSAETWTQLLPEALLNVAETNQINNLMSEINGTNFITLAVQEILKNAKNRNDPITKKLSADKISLPALLLLNQVLQHGTITQSAISSMIEDIIMPVYLAN